MPVPISMPRPLDQATDLLLSEIVSRSGYLVDVGLGYLTLDRQSRTLSGGEVQRINLTTALGTSLVNTLFVSMYLRPKLAAERSRVLNFYWMFVGLVTGVYALGLPGLVLGPALIAVLKAVVDAVVAPTTWPAVGGEGPDPQVADGIAGGATS